MKNITMQLHSKFGMSVMLGGECWRGRGGVRGEQLMLQNCHYSILNCILLLCGVDLE